MESKTELTGELGKTRKWPLILLIDMSDWLCLDFTKSIFEPNIVYGGGKVEVRVKITTWLRLRNVSWCVG